MCVIEHVQVYHKCCCVCYTLCCTAGCEQYLDAAPFESLESAEAFVEENTLFQGADVTYQNKISSQRVKSVGFELLDVYPSSMLRRDGHRDNGDCLYYRMPSLMRHWNRMLLNTLLQPPPGRMKGQSDEADGLREPDSTGDQCPYFGQRGASVSDCKSRDQVLLRHILYNASMQELLEAGRLCGESKGRVGYLEQCCSIHQWETSGYGNQLLQVPSELYISILRENIAPVNALVGSVDVITACLGSHNAPFKVLFVSSYLTGDQWIAVCTTE